MNNIKVNIWEEQIFIPTYPTSAPDKNPMFFENRIYQGSSGVVYPNLVIEKIEDEKVERSYRALFLENQYLKIMILPELGGRVHMAYDKIANRHFIYYNQVIKPALVGLCGPWISGGIEFNWPQHHRPSTFESIDYTVEENGDGSKTIWVNEIEKMFHTKGMAGFTLYPDKAYLEVKALLYNRTNLPQTFLWWANPAVKVNDHYQSIFPPDVNAVFDHGKRDVSSFPIATGTYYKFDYSPGTDISRYKNIPVPTSYMAVSSNYDFVGGYEHDTHAGLLHIADHHISPGKKQWTWGNGDFGMAWDRNLTDEDGPYIELMTGVYTDNQPDFSWLMPYEEKSFTQYFLPYREVGIVKNATKDILVALSNFDKILFIKVFSTSRKNGLKITLKIEDKILFEQTFDVSPEKVYVKDVEFREIINESRLQLYINEPSGIELIRYIPSIDKKKEIPKPAQPPLPPKDVQNIEELFLIGQHLEQYRHATFSPVPYYEEALRRNPMDMRTNNALGKWYLRRGQFTISETYFRNAVDCSIQYNPNPYDSEPYYNLGVTLEYQEKTDEAYDAFYKSTWSAECQSGAYFSLAQIDIRRKDYCLALEHINWSIDKNARNGKAYLLKVHCLRLLNRIAEAIDIANNALQRDKFNLCVLFELSYCYKSLEQESKVNACFESFSKLSRGVSHNLIEYAIEYSALGCYQEAIEILRYANIENQKDPMINYYLSYYWSKIGNRERSGFYQNKTVAGRGNCFPNRLEDIATLQYAQTNYPHDAYSFYYLGNLWYDKRQYSNAISCWQQSAELDSSFPTVFRNLGIAHYNKLKDKVKAKQFFEKAHQLNINDSRVLMELDQLYKRLNTSVEVRLKTLKTHYTIVKDRDDLYLELAACYNFLGNFNKAYDLIMDRKFHPWEGGEGKVSSQYIISLVGMAKNDLKNGRYNDAILKLGEALIYPPNLGEGKLPGTQENDIFYWLGTAYNELHNIEQAHLYWSKATKGLSEPSAALFYNDQQPDKIFYQGLAWREIGQSDKSVSIFQKLVAYGEKHIENKAEIDYFAVSLPDLLIFEDDLINRNYIHCQYISGLGYLGLQDFKKTKILLNEVLENDAMHFGAKTHLSILENMNNKSILPNENGIKIS